MNTSSPEGFPPTTGCDERRAMLLEWANQPDEAISPAQVTEQPGIVIRGLGVALDFVRSDQMLKVQAPEHDAWN